MLMMGGQGTFGMKPDVAIFADTGNEPPEVYTMIEWLSENQPIEIKIVRGKRPLLEAFRSAEDADGNIVGSVVPVYGIHEDGTKIMTRRLCTRHWKIRPIETEMRKRLGWTRVSKASEIRAEQWIGITTDEIERVKPSPTHWVDNRHPLIEADMSRQDCLDWWEENAPKTAPPLARSACAICPYRSSSEWAELYEKNPQMVLEAAQAEEEYKLVRSQQNFNPKITHYLHRRYKPLMEGVLENVREKEDGLFARADECTGYCWI